VIRTQRLGLGFFEGFPEFGGEFVDAHDFLKQNMWFQGI
jgi:hypothetical protein